MFKILVEVCSGTHCTLMGAMDIINAVEWLREPHEGIDPNCEIEVRPVSCNQACVNGSKAPVVKVNGEMLLQTDPESVMARILSLADLNGNLAR